MYIVRMLICMQVCTRVCMHEQRMKQRQVCRRDFVIPICIYSYNKRSCVPLWLHKAFERQSACSRSVSFSPHFTQISSRSKLLLKILFKKYFEELDTYVSICIDSRVSSRRNFCTDCGTKAASKIYRLKGRQVYLIFDREILNVQKFQL